MKKIFCLLLISTMMFTACNNNKTADAKTSTESTNTTAADGTAPSTEGDKTDVEKEVDAEYQAFRDKLLTTTSDMPQFSELIEGEDIAVIETNQGTIKVRFFPEEAPMAVENFITLAKKGYYDGQIFHRVINDFMIQGGDPTGTGTGGESAGGGKFADEFSPKLYHFRGALVMANSGADTNGSQFFIEQKNVLTDGYFDYVKQVVEKYGSTELIYSSNSGKIMRTNYDDAVKAKYSEVGGSPDLDYGYTIFGQAFEGMDVVDAIAKTPTDENDKPLEDVKIEKITIENYKAK